MEQGITQIISRLIGAVELMALENPHDPHLHTLLKNADELRLWVKQQEDDFLKFAQQLGAVITLNES